MSDITARIEAWQTAGLIDADTAARLRAAERSAESSDEPGPTTTAAVDAQPRGTAGTVGAAFGPSPTIVEMFAYLGAAFFIAAYSSFLSRFGNSSPDRDVIMTVGSAIATVALVAIGAWLARRGARARRGAGVLFVVAVNGAAITAAFLVQVFGWDWSARTELFIAGMTVAVAVALRAWLPATTTQVGLLGALTLLGGAILDTIRRALDGRLLGDPVGPGFSSDFVQPVASIGKDVVLPTVGWLLIASALGALGLWEARRGTQGATARAAISRFWAGMVAIIGGWSGLSASGYLGDSYGRILPPWIGDVILILVVAVLVERALRRDSVAFILPAAIGLIAALTDLNFAYLSDTTEVGLLVEGAILLAVGFAADRIRRSVTGRPPPPIATGEALA